MAAQPFPLRVQRLAQLASVRRIGQPEALALDLAAIALALTIGGIVASIPASASDYGQWLMLSRFYVGEDVPDYRNVTAIPPLLPASLGLLRLLVHDDVLALQVYKGVLGAGLVLSFYLAGWAIFERRAAGLLSAVFAFLMTDRLLELFAFGGLPQLLAMVFMGLSIAAFARGGTVTGLQWRWWLIGTAALVLAMFSHTALGTLAFVTGSAVAGASVLRNESLSWRRRAMALSPLAAAVLVLAIYYAVVLLPQNDLYVANPASENYRYPGLIWRHLSRYQPTLFLLWAGAAVAVAGPALELARRRRIGGFCIAAVWAAALWGILGFAIISGAKTEYPRFVAPILVPLAITAGGGVAVLAAHGWAAWQDRSALVRRILPYSAGVAGLACAAAIALWVGPGTIGRHYTESRWYAQSYSAADREALKAAVLELDRDLPAGASVLATKPLEGKWIEGVSGREALFGLPVRYSVRMIERERTSASEAILRSRLAVTNQFFFIKYVGSRDTGDGRAVPEQPWIAVNHRGEFAELVRILSTGSRVTSAGGGILATVSGLAPQALETDDSGGRVSIATTWAGEAGGNPLTYSRTITLGEDARSFEIVDEATGAGAHGLEIELVPMQGKAPSNVVIAGNQVDMYYPTAGRSAPHIRIAAPDGGVAITTQDGRVVVRAPGSTRLRLVVTSPTPSEPIQPLRLLDPERLVEEYSVGAVLLLASDPSTGARIERLRALGFTRAGGSGRYLTLTREPSSGEPVPPPGGAGESEPGAAGVLP